MDETGSTMFQGEDAEQALADPDDPPWSCSGTTDPILEIDLHHDVGRSIDVTWIHDQLGKVVAKVADSTSRCIKRVSVLIVGDDEMINLNRRHFSKDSTTDVISFNSGGDSSELIEGDIVICADEAVRRADELGHSIERELLLYALHGLLHCAGFDDQTDSDAQAMHEEEDRILKATGVGSTFHLAERSSNESRIQSP